jgi:hypothetical protein
LFGEACGALKLCQSCACCFPNEVPRKQTTSVSPVYGVASKLCVCIWNALYIRCTSCAFFVGTQGADTCSHMCYSCYDEGLGFVYARASLLFAPLHSKRSHTMYIECPKSLLRRKALPAVEHLTRNLSVCNVIRVCVECTRVCVECVCCMWECVLYVCIVSCVCFIHL